MAVGANRTSVYTTASGGSEGRNGEKKDLWSSMLDSVASSKRLPEKNLLVLGMLMLHDLRLQRVSKANAT